MKNVSILGSTGSIGRQTLDIIESQAAELSVTCLAAGSGNLPLLCEQIVKFAPKLVCVPDQQAISDLKELLDNHPAGAPTGALTSAPTRPKSARPELVCGQPGLIAAATADEVDIVVTAVVGFLGVLPTEAAIKCGKTIALANKETLVAAGSIIMPLARQHNARIIPVDSEHSAIFQSLGASRENNSCVGAEIGSSKNSDIRSIWLTASGGPFRTWSKEDIGKATIADALNHPNWAMGPKITVDSATMLNKGLEVIEARWLFDVMPEQIKVIIHPQSILHSAVEFADGSVIGQMGVPDMRLPIHYALFHPQRTASQRVPALDLTKLAALTFEAPDLERFPCLRLAQEIAAKEDTSACVLNAANEIAVAAFLAQEIGFSQIYSVISEVLHRHCQISNPTLDDILASDHWSRQEARTVIEKSGHRSNNLADKSYVMKGA